MLLKGWISTVLTACALVPHIVPAACRMSFEQLIQNNEQRQIKNVQDQDAETATLEAEATKHFRYLTNVTQPYRVKSLPDFPGNIGEMYSGLVPINMKDPSRQLFFIFQPTLGAPVNSLTIWFNGGPGCSSLVGFLQENGQFLWQPGSSPTVNPYPWSNLTNMLWVEQPVGVGYTTGKVTAKNEVDIAKDFVGFFKNFEKLFGIKNYHIYVTGESYAGRYVPYVSAEMLNQKDLTYLNLKGALVYDPCIGSWNYVQEEIVAVPFVTENNDIVNLNDTFLAQLQSLHESCGYADYFDKYLTFPPPGLQPQTPAYGVTPPKGTPPYSGTCDVFDQAYAAMIEVNPCFNIYEVTAGCPAPRNVLSYPENGQQIYFNRTDVKKALHAPLDSDWYQCNGPVFLGGKGYGGPEYEGDLSPDPIQGVLPQVIEATNRVLVSNGDFDYIIMTNGTLLSIQNMTWNGVQGFQSAPSTPIVIDIPDLDYGTGPQGTMGRQHYERGLMWAETYQSGHMQPQFQPRVTYRHLQWLLGIVDVL